MCFYLVVILLTNVMPFLSLTLMLCPLRKVSPITINSSGWWFQAFFMFHNRWDNFRIDFHIFQDGNCTTNQSCSVNHRESHGEPGSGHHLRPTLGGLQPQLRGAGERGPLDCRGRQFRDKSWECSDSLGS